MSHLHQVLAGQVDRWRADGYPSSEYPAIAEILEWSSDADRAALRFLRRPQLRALETYWYLRLVEGTPHVFALYQRLFANPRDLLDALGLTASEIRDVVLGRAVDHLWDRIRTDDDFVRRNRLESVRETLTLDYPSYILALAMGAGKTVLIGAIIAAEFAMALEYPDAPFVQNALVFAPGTTIIESLRELAAIPYETLLPPRLHKPFAASVKLTFTRDGDRDIPVVRGSLYNVVVTNTEKIRVQKETVRRADIGDLFSRGREDEARAEVANLRLQAIASLPHLGVFSDEAHHTYGQSLDAGLKKVRKTVDYLAANTNVLAVVNTTGTPYFQRQPLRDVVIWYGLSEGIRDNILKDVSGNIHAFRFDDNAGAFVSRIVEDFFRDYGDVALPNGAPARLAVYFPQTDDLEELRPVIDATLGRLGLSPTLCLRNTSESTKDEIAAFNRLSHDPTAPHRLILLVNKGTEGWNCPSLFACALARRLKSSNNFVLQAATRCLRQVPGNIRKARIYLSEDNRAILDRQLQETYGESIADLSTTTREVGTARLVVRKADRPPVTLTRLVRMVAPAGTGTTALKLERPALPEHATITRNVFDIARQQGTRRLLQQIGATEHIDVPVESVDRYEAAVALGAAYRADVQTILDEISRVYDTNDVPLRDLTDLGRQISEQMRGYEVREEQVEWALALVKPEGFTKVTDADGTDVYVAEITYPKDKEHLLLSTARVENPGRFGFHVDPYDFDSAPELDFFQQLLREVNLHPSEVEDIYFTGGLTDPAKTDFAVDYLGEDGRWHRYTPDFVIRKRPAPGRPAGTGRVLIVEVKSTQFRTATADDEERFRRGEEPHTNEGRKAIALRRLEQLNPDRLKYQLVFVRTSVSYDDLAETRRFVREPERAYGDDLITARALAQRIVDADGQRVRKIILLGSRARGDARPDSDYDLLVVVPGIVPSDIRPYTTRLYRALAGAGVVAEPFVMSEEEFEETKTVVGGLARPAWKEGVVLYENA